MAKSPRAVPALNTAIGKKVVMAITGLALCLFLMGHLAGNLLLLRTGSQFLWFNAYSYYLNSLPVLLIIELGLVALFLIHAYEGLQVTLENRRARPVDYEVKVSARTKSDKSRKTASSSTMMWSGTVILLFVILHVWQFKYGPKEKVAPGEPTPTVGLTGPGVATPGAETPGQAKDQLDDLARLVVTEFHKPLVVALYVFAMVMLGLHLFHAVSSAFQTLGTSNPKVTDTIRLLGQAFAFIVAAGFALLPLWVYFVVR